MTTNVPSKTAAVAVHALAIDWHGPFNLKDAQAQCQKLDFKDGVYVTFGRHRAFGLWPIWRRASWQPALFSFMKRRLTTKFDNWPIQYIGQSQDLPSRVKHDEHEMLYRLDPKRSFVFIGVPTSDFNPETRDGHKHLSVVSALERALIYALKPRLNRDWVKGPPPDAFVFQFSHKPIVRQKGHQGRAAQRLPSLMRRMNQSPEMVIEFGQSRAGRGMRISATEQKRRPVESFSRWFEDSAKRLFRKIFGAPASKTFGKVGPQDGT